MNRDDYSRLFDAALRASLSGSSKELVVDNDDWLQIISPNERSSRQNMVLISNSTQTEREKIAATIESYREQRLPFQWRVTNLSLPSNLSDLLMAEGMNLIVEADALIGIVDNIRIPLNKDICVVDVCMNNVDDYIEAAYSGWSEFGLTRKVVEKDIRSALDKGVKGKRFYVAYSQGSPAGIGNLELSESAGLLVSSATSKLHRNKGVYSQLVRHRLEILKDHGIAHALIEAKAGTSSPICQKLGFKAIGKIKYFEMSWSD